MAYPKNASEEEIRAIRRRDSSSEAGRAARRRYRQSEKGKAAERRAAARRAERTPEKVAARDAVNKAVKAGRLVKGPCEQVGPTCSGPIEGHHDDYGKPLQVRWLCSIHHNQHHGKG